MLQRFVDPAAIAAQIERVWSLSGDAPRRRWRAPFARPVPSTLMRKSASVPSFVRSSIDRAGPKQAGGLLTFRSTSCANRASVVGNGAPMLIGSRL